MPKRLTEKEVDRSGKVWEESAIFGPRGDA
jgi:hypothetical protein